MRRDIILKETVLRLCFYNSVRVRTEKTEQCRLLYRTALSKEHYLYKFEILLGGTSRFYFLFKKGALVLFLLTLDVKFCYKDFFSLLKKKKYKNHTVRVFACIHTFHIMPR